MVKLNEQNNHDSYSQLVDTIKSIYKEKYITLHRPVFDEYEKSMLCTVIESNFVSSAGMEIDVLEKQVAAYVGTDYAVSVTSGTAALHLALVVAGIGRGDEVITQALTFVATGNAILYTGADPVFVDVNKKNYGMCPKALRDWLAKNTYLKNKVRYNKSSGKRVIACLPVHIFGMPCEIEQIVEICQEYNLILIEDAAEALGSKVGGRHCGSFGDAGIFSFNGNKIMTTGGGGMLVTDDEHLAVMAKHLSTTAKAKDRIDYFHDQLGYNYRMPNLNAALGIAQLEKLDNGIKEKRCVHKIYSTVCDEYGIQIQKECNNKRSNFWLNAVELDNLEARNKFIELCATNDIMVRPIWHPLHLLPAFTDFSSSDLTNTLYLSERIVNLPSSVPCAR